jgi:leucyl aminopeptidase
LHYYFIIIINTTINIYIGFEMSTWNATELSNMGAGAYKAVIQANANSNINDRLIRLRYEPITDNDNSNSKEIYFPQTSVTIGSIYNKDITNNDNTKANGDTSNWGKPAPPSIDRKRPIVLVGKGVTYDTGGLNIKTGNSMKTMKHDMAGSAAALGLMLALGNTITIVMSSSL